MIVYVETNWILDIVLKQEKRKESIQVLNASKKGEIILVLPMVCIGEAYNNMSRRKEEMVRTLEACRPVLNRNGKEKPDA